MLLRGKYHISMLPFTVWLTYTRSLTLARSDSVSFNEPTLLLPGSQEAGSRHAVSYKLKELARCKHVPLTER